MKGFEDKPKCKGAGIGWEATGQGLRQGVA